MAKVMASVMPILLLASFQCAGSLQLRPLRSVQHAPSRHARIGACAADKEDKASLDETALMESFQARLQKEGGATQLRLRTDASRAAGEVKDTFSSAAEKVSDAASGLLDAGQGRPPSDGLLDQNQWRLTVGFFVFLIVASVINALAHSGAADAGVGASTGVDMFTSDGRALQFGRQ